MQTMKYRQPLQRQKGVVMVVVLLLLGIMSIVGVMNLRNSATTEQVSNNMRLASVAQQAAELALKYCESVAADTAGATFATERTKILSATITGSITSGAWNTTSTWNSSANYLTINNAFALSTDVHAVQFANPPQCVIEKISNASGKGYVITARGFGNDAKLTATNGVRSGSEAWVQSVLME
jgi:Tfp pilus assembly protein PilX